MALRPLYSACRAALAACPAAAPFLAGLPEDPGPETPRQPVENAGTRNLAGAQPGPGFETLLGAIKAAAPRLEWRQSYKSGEGMDEYRARAGYVELTGQRGAFGAPVNPFGIFVIGPGCLYPLHRHEPAEIYLPIAGSGEWHYPPAPWTRHGTGEGVVTEPHAWHAIRTGQECLVMVYAWIGGDPVTVSEIMKPVS